MPPTSAASSSFRWTNKTALLLVLLSSLTAYPCAASVSGAYVSLPSLSSTSAFALSLPTNGHHLHNNNDASARHPQVHAPEEDDDDDADNDIQRTKVYGQPRCDRNRNRQGTIRTAANNDIGGSPDRRRALRVVATSLATIVVGAARDSAAWALPIQEIDEGSTTDSVFDPSSSSLVRSALQDRIDNNLLAQPNYGMDGPDVFYPSWFQGTWKATSTIVNVSAPCGVALFGGNATYQRARNEIGTSLVYRARFVPFSSSSNANMMIADREYNVVSIAQSAMGPNSMVNVEKATPNEFACTLLSGGGGGAASNNNLFRVNMLTVQRKQELVGGGNVASSTSSNLQTFACSEVVQELIRPVAVAAAPAAGATGAASTPPTVAAAPPPPASILKQIETISVYRYDPTSADPNMIDCLQRTASYLVPSQSDPVMAQLYRMSQGLPVDVRHYRVQYKTDDPAA